jgi:hypothetical protein
MPAAFLQLLQCEDFNAGQPLCLLATAAADAALLQIGHQLLLLPLLLLLLLPLLLLLLWRTSRHQHGTRFRIAPAS